MSFSRDAYANFYDMASFKQDAQAREETLRDQFEVATYMSVRF
jgi:hypothetical protein